MITSSAGVDVVVVVVVSVDGDDEALTVHSPHSGQSFLCFRLNETLRQAAEDPMGVEIRSVELLGRSVTMFNQDVPVNGRVFVAI